MKRMRDYRRSDITAMQTEIARLKAKVVTLEGRLLEENGLKIKWHTKGQTALERLSVSESKCDAIRQVADRERMIVNALTGYKEA
jgi:hypothetical protein